MKGGQGSKKVQIKRCIGSQGQSLSLGGEAGNPQQSSILGLRSRPSAEPTGTAANEQRRQRGPGSGGRVLPTRALRKRGESLFPEPPGRAKCNAEDTLMGGGPGFLRPFLSLCLPEMIRLLTHRCIWQTLKIAAEGAGDLK